MKKRILIISMILIVLMSVIGCSNDVNQNANEAVLNENSKNEQAVNEENTSGETTEVVEEAIVYGDNKGFLWEVKNEDATVYLFGSIHMADESLYPFHETVEKAFEASDILGVEADVSDIKAIQALAPSLMYEGDDTVYNHLSDDGIQKFEMICTEINLKPKLFEKFRVWVVGSNLMSMQLLKSEYSGTEGVDMYFLDKAKKTDKDVVELEGMSFQIDMMNSFTDEQQESIFLSSLGTTEETIEDFRELYDIYLTGDEQLMTDYLFNTDNEMTSDDEVEEAILIDRNVGMAEKIEAYLQTDKTYFVVVGLAHYLGDDSVMKYLENKGYTVERK
ncbi:MAG: TraB/GumN family protein [Clostridiales bacterium]|nr:TraB/GumN family protein [Clostridiales bacterium]